MAKLHLGTPYLNQSPPSGNPYPTIERYTLATLPAQGTNLKVALVTDGTFAPGSGQGSAYVGGDSLLNVIWWNGFSWITI